MTFSQDNNTYSANELIVKFRSNADYNFKNCILKQKFGNAVLDSLNNELKVQRIQLTGNKKKKDTYLLKFKTEQNINHLIKLYENTGLFEYVEPNYIGTGGGIPGQLQVLPNDTHFSRQYGLYNDGSFSLSPATTDADIDMELAWDIELGSSSIIIAVLDAGVKMDHPELAGRIWENSNESDNSIDDDNNGYIDDVVGWDFANDDNDPTDDYGHGTNVTGIIGANGDNSLGYTGVDWHSKLMICKILDENNSGFYSWWTDAIYYAVDNDADVINMSVGGSGFSSTMQEAINYAYDNGVAVVACMMNENNSVTYYPAGYQNTIAVGSTNANDERSSPFFWDSESGSNYGSHIDVVAPGNYIYGLSYQSNTNYNTYWGGTSQATPLVTGLCALLLAQDPSRTPDDLRNIIINTAEDQIGKPSEDILGFDNYYGYGRINAFQALLQNTVNIDEINYDELKIFPNPTSENLFVKSLGGYSEISIINMLGYELYRKKAASSPEVLMIDVSNFPQGLYFINVIEKDRKKFHSEKMIKN